MYCRYIIKRSHLWCKSYIWHLPWRTLTWWLNNSTHACFLTRKLVTLHTVSINKCNWEEHFHISRAIYFISVKRRKALNFKSDQSEGLRVSKEQLITQVALEEWSRRIQSLAQSKNIPHKHLSWRIQMVELLATYSCCLIVFAVRFQRSD